MATIAVEGIRKVYSNGFEAVKGIDLHVADGEFMVLVGPSGCGKTTLLRMVAGLEDISGGSLLIDGKVANDMGPKARDIAMVFQNYALYPHMTVAENIGFPLKLRGVSKSEIDVHVREAAGVLGLGDLLKVKPGQLSGGQRQRVAMGRAIVREPSVFLMDEPLSNLDAKLRVQMRGEVSRIQRRLGVATVYVTHDQVEAMTMGDRVAVLHDGRLQQCDDPQTLYDRPVNAFVASFIGSPAMNLYEATIGEGSRSVQIGSQSILLSEGVRQRRPGLAKYVNQRLVVGLRPEALQVSTQSNDSQLLKTDVDLVEALGNELLVHFNIDAKRIVAEEQDSGEEVLANRGEGIARIDPRTGVRPGTKVTFEVDVDRLQFFDLESGDAIWE
jgi:multiple sugar transport system ATP-binding protein